MLKQEAEILKKVHKLNSAIQNLRLVASGGFPAHWDKRHGLCHNLLNIENISGVDLYSVFESWEYFSGDMVFPVEETHFEYYENNPYTGKYAEKRRHLAGHCADWIENNMSKLL